MSIHTTKMQLADLLAVLDPFQGKLAQAAWMLTRAAENRRK